jgi:hypothetical protein
MSAHPSPSPTDTQHSKRLSRRAQLRSQQEQRRAALAAAANRPSSTSAPGSSQVVDEDSLLYPLSNSTEHCLIGDELTEGEESPSSDDDEAQRRETGSSSIEVSHEGRSFVNDKSSFDREFDEYCKVKLRYFRSLEQKTQNLSQPQHVRGGHPNKRTRRAMAVSSSVTNSFDYFSLFPLSHSLLQSHHRLKPSHLNKVSPRRHIAQSAPAHFILPSSAHGTSYSPSAKSSAPIAIPERTRRVDDFFFESPSVVDNVLPQRTSSHIAANADFMMFSFAEEIDPRIHY